MEFLRAATKICWLVGILAAVLGPQPAPCTSAQEIFCTQSYAEANLDSCAVWNGPDNSRRLVVTGKESHQLLVFDGFSGEFRRTVGEAGPGLGQFRRPNGIFIIDNYVFVVERDNKRCQVLRMPGFRPVGTFGEGLLKKPYGIYICQASDQSGYAVYITDDYDPEQKGSPPLSERGKYFSVTVAGGGTGSAPLLQARLNWCFGASAGRGAIEKAESIWGDPENDRLLLADEAAKTIKVYRLSDGSFTGRVFGAGRFLADPEGISLLAREGASKGMWITTDQRETGLTRFHVFDRQSLDYMATFTGARISNTDGIWLDSGSGRQTALLYAVHDDQAVCAMGWEKLVEAIPRQ